LRELDIEISGDGPQRERRAASGTKLCPKRAFTGRAIPGRNAARASNNAAQDFPVFARQTGLRYSIGKPASFLTFLFGFFFEDLSAGVEDDSVSKRHSGSPFSHNPRNNSRHVRYHSAQS
jgi:hypothetical protein